jgi:hypothetical protein
MVVSEAKMTGKATPHPDGQEWLRRWDRQQEVYIPSREACYQIMLDAVAASDERIHEYYNEKKKREGTNLLADDQREGWRT